MRPNKHSPSFIAKEGLPVFFVHKKAPGIPWDSGRLGQSFSA